MWSELTKDTELSKMESYISAWKLAYQGKPEWLKYEYATLAGRNIERIRKTMNPARLICSELSSLVWSEMPEVDIDDGVLKVLADNLFFKLIQGKLERATALGGMAFRLFVQDNKIKIDYIPADRFIPVTYENGRITEADIIDYKTIKGKKFLRVEKHRKSDTGYMIINEVKEVQGKGFLSPQPLSKFDKTLVEFMDLDVKAPLFSYYKNPEENIHFDESPLGMSFYGSAMDIIESLDTAFDALQSEIKLGKKRIIVPASAVRNVIDPNTGKPVRYFDPQDEIYQALDTEDKENLKISDNSVNLRIAEIRQAIQTLLDILSIQVGFSAGYISFDGNSGLKTATEIISENSKTFKTKKTHESAIEESLLNLFESIRELGKIYNYPVTDQEYSIVWQDSIIEDRNSKTEYVHKRLKEGTIELYRALMLLDGLDETEAKARAEAISSENATIDASDAFGGFEA